MLMGNPGGGYITVGNIVIVCLIVQLKQNTNFSKVATGLPKPYTGDYYPISAFNVNQKKCIAGAVDADGCLCVGSSNKEEWLTITGSYITR